VQVKELRLADFINNQVGKRSYYGPEGKVVVKMDIEGEDEGNFMFELFGVS
jgi:ribosomal protein L31E